MNRRPEERDAAPWISLAVLFLVVLAVGGWMLRPQAAPPPSGQAQIDLAEELVRLGDEAFLSWHLARRSNKPKQAKAERARALTLFGQAMDTYNAALEPFRDPEGFLPPEYEGYEERLQYIAVRLVDLERG